MSYKKGKGEKEKKRKNILALFLGGVARERADLRGAAAHPARPRRRADGLGPPAHGPRALPALSVPLQRSKMLSKKRLCALHKCVRARSRSHAALVSYCQRDDE